VDGKVGCHSKTNRWICSSPGKLLKNQPLPPKANRRKNSRALRGSPQALKARTHFGRLSGTSGTRALPEYLPNGFFSQPPKAAVILFALRRGLKCVRENLSFALTGLALAPLSTHGLRRGLHSCAALRLCCDSGLLIQVNHDTHLLGTLGAVTVFAGPRLLMICQSIRDSSALITNSTPAC
jgi:hypothetical protein